MLRVGMLGVIGCILSANAVAECTDGYSMNDAGGCVAECAPGYYVATAGTPCVKITGSLPIYTDTLHVVKYGETSGDNVKHCPRGDDMCHDVTIPSSLVHDNINNCVCSRGGVRYTISGDDIRWHNWNSTHGIGQQSCYYTTGTDGNAIYDNQQRDPTTGEKRKACVGSATLDWCDAGYWSDKKHDGESLQNFPCLPVGAGYYSPDGDLERYACPDGTATCGYGDWAASVSDCVPYKTLKIAGDYPDIMLISREQVDARLHVRMPDGALYHGILTNGARSGHIAVRMSDGAVMSLVNPLEQFETREKSGRTVYLIP